MCISYLIIALAVASVRSRPQLAVYSPQQTFVSVQLNSAYGDHRTSTQGSGQRVHLGDETGSERKFLNTESTSGLPSRRMNEQYFKQKPVIANRNNNQMYLDNPQNTTERTGLNKEQTYIQSNLDNQAFINTNPVSNYPTYQRLQQAPAHKNCTRHNFEKKPDKDREIQQTFNQAQNTQPINYYEQVMPINNSQQTIIYQNKFTPTNVESQNPNTLPNNRIHDNRTATDRLTIEQSSQMNQTGIIYRSDGVNTDQIRKTVTVAKNDNSRRSNSSSLDSKPVFANSGATYANPSVQRHKSKEVEEDQWVWGYSNGVTEKAEEGTTPDLADRASFDGGTCPSGKVKVQGKCVDED